MTALRLLTMLDRISEAPGAIARLRQFILDLAVRGKLVRTRAEEARLDGPDERPFAIPGHWEWTTIGDSLHSSLYGPRFAAEDYSPSGVPTVRTTDMTDDGRIVLNAPPAVLVSDDQLEAYRCERGDLLVTRTGTIGKMAIFDDTYPAIPSAYLIRLRLKPAALPRFVLTLLKSSYGQRSLGANVTKVAQPNINAKSLRRIALPLPPVDEQHQVISKVDELMALCDGLEAAQVERETRRNRLVAASLCHLNSGATPEQFREHARFYINHLPRLTTRPEQIKDIRRTILSLAVAGGLTGVRTPAWTSLGAISSEFRYGTSTKCSHEPVGTPVLRIPNVQNGRVDVSDLKYGRLTDREARDLGLRAGDILVVRSNGSLDLVGRPALVEKDVEGFCFAGYLVRLRTDPAIVDPKYLVKVLTSPQVRRQIEGPIRTTVGLKNINSQELSNLSIPLPPLGEQRRIVAKVDQLMAICDELESQLAAAQTERRRLLAAVLREALTSAATQTA